MGRKQVGGIFKVGLNSVLISLSFRKCLGKAIKQTTVGLALLKQ